MILSLNQTFHERMALVTVQRSPSPSQSGTDLDEGDAPACTDGSRVSGKQKRSRASSLVKRCINSMRFISRIRVSESYFTVKGAALILPNSEACKRKASKAAHGGDIQNHLQAMCHLLRPQDTLQVAVKLENVYMHKRARYFAVVSCSGRQDTEESAVLGFDCPDDDTKAVTVGLVLPVWANTCTSMNGDGGFTIRTANDRTANERMHSFNPVTVQAMWSGLHVLHKVCDNANACCYVPSGLTHTWISYYESKMALADPLAIGEWNMTDDLIAAVKSGEGNLACTPTVSEHEDIKKQIRPKLREIMIRMDLEDVTSVYLREQLEAVLCRNLKEYKSFIDEEMIVVMGQLDSPSRIFDFLFLGSEWNASNLDELNRNGIGYILNVTKEIDNFFPGLFKYHNVRVYDTEDTDLLRYWEATHKFILRAVEANSKVLVHCKMGVSRSASTVIAFAMKQYNWSFEKAHDFVLTRRSVVRPNDGFRHQLQLYEGILKASNQRHSDLWRSKSESNLKMQLHNALSSMQLESYGEGSPADQHGNGNGERSAAESSSCREGSSAMCRQSDANAVVALRPRSWSSRSMDKDRGVLTGTKSTSCLMELDSSLDEDDAEDRSSSSSDSNSSGDGSDDGEAFAGVENDSKPPCRHQRCYDVTVSADSPANVDGGCVLADGSADISASPAEISAASADPAVPTSPATGSCVVAGATASRPSTLDISQQAQAATTAPACLPTITAAHDGSCVMPGDGAPCGMPVSPMRTAYCSKATGSPLAGGVGPHKVAESPLIQAKRVPSPSSSAGTAKGGCVTVPTPSTVPPTAVGSAAGCEWVPPAAQQPRAAADAVGSLGATRTSPCRGGSSRDASPAKLIALELLTGSSRSPSEECPAAAASPADQAISGGAAAARPNSLEWIWRQRYAMEDIPWSPGTVRRQKDMLECVRARAAAASGAAAAAAGGASGAASAATPEAVSAGCGAPAISTPTHFPETDSRSACDDTKIDDPCSTATAGVEGYQPAPGTVKKVRREFEERLIGDDESAVRSCTVQRSSSLRGLPQLPGGRSPPPPAALQRSASVRERRSAACLCQAGVGSISGDDGSDASADRPLLPRPVSAIVPSPSPLLHSAPRPVASSSNVDLRQRPGGVGCGLVTSALAGMPAVQRAASLSSLTACPLPAGDSVKFVLGGGKMDCERRQPSGVRLADSSLTPAVGKPKQDKAGLPDVPRPVSHLATHLETCYEPLLRHQAQQLRDETAAASTQAWPVTLRSEQRGLRRCKSSSSGGSPSMVACKKAHRTAQHGSQELAASPQLKHTSSVRNLVYVFEASWRNSWSSKEESAPHAHIAATSSPQPAALSCSARQTSPLIRTHSLCVPCSCCTGGQRSSANGSRSRSGHTFSRRSWIASAVFPTT